MVRKLERDAGTRAVGTQYQGTCAGGGLEWLCVARDAYEIVPQVRYRRIVDVHVVAFTDEPLTQLDARGPPPCVSSRLAGQAPHRYAHAPRGTQLDLEPPARPEPVRGASRASVPPANAPPGAT